MAEEPIWYQFLTPRDKQVFGNAGYGQRAGWGKRPDTKRAIVSLAEGHRIDIFGGPVS